MSNAEAIAAKEILDGLTEAGAILSFSEAVGAAQVHAILAVAEELEQLIRVLRERP